MPISMKIEVEAIGDGWVGDNNQLKVNFSSAINSSCYKPGSIVDKLLAIKSYIFLMLLQ